MKHKGLLLTLLIPNLLMAGQVEIKYAEFSQRGNSWSANVTLQHEDTGWEHYADSWRIVTVDGKELGVRTLYHPHVSEQPFTRSLSGIFIPQNVNVVYVEAHDKVHGWSADRLEVDLTQSKGTRYQVKR